MNDKRYDSDKEIITVHYSRSQGTVERENDIDLTQNQAEMSEQSILEEEILDKITLNWPHYIAYFLMSIVVSVTTVVLPYMDLLGNSLQLHHLYTGLGMAQGQMPYSSIFATGGVLYYTIIALLGIVHLEWALVIVQSLALFLSGVYFEKLLIRLTNKNGLGQSFTLIFYLFQLAIGFGGLYPIQWAMPFTLMSLYYLGQYFVNQAKDEVFIAYGLLMALALLLDPKTVVIYLVMLLVLLVHNTYHRRFARGFYQFLSLSFGFVLLFYTALYFILNVQILSPLLEQTLLYPFSVLGFENDHIWLTLGLQFGVLMLSGILTGVFLFYKLIKQEQVQKAIYWILCLVTVIYSILALLSQTLWLYPILYVLPFGLLLTGVWVTKNQKDIRRPKLVGFYFKKHLFFPVIIILAGIAYPIAMGLLQYPINQERDELANLLVMETADSDRIYVWDSSPRIYQSSHRLPASQIILPVLYTKDNKNSRLLDDELLQHQATYILVNKTLPLSDSLEKDLSNHYKKAALKNMTYFDVFELK